MKIGNVEITGAALAPMAGVADSALRRLCKEYGAGYVVSEMVSAKGLSYHDRKSAKLMRITPQERPMGIQLFGSEPEVLARSAELAQLQQPDILDINMGCPAPKITGQGAGAALMRSPKLCGDIISAVVQAAKVPVTVKLRLGWDEQSRNVAEIARIAQECGASAITVHGRTREQMYAGTADYAAIRRVAQSVSIPVIANGDVTDALSAKRALEQTGCPMVMVGRGALGAPWVFAQINAYLQRGELPGEPPLEKRMETLLRQVQWMVQDKGEAVALREARKHAAWYFKGLRGAAALRRQAGTVRVYSDLQRLCEQALQMDAQEPA